MLWAMSNYCRNEEKGEEKVDKIQRNLEYEYVHIVMNLVQNAFNENIVVACLRIIGNLSCGSDQQCGHLLRMGLINSIHKLLMNKSKVIRRDVCWIYSNIASGNAEQVNELVS